MRVTQCCLIQGEEVAEVTDAEMSLHIVLLIHHTATQSLLVSLPLQHLLLNAASLQHITHHHHLLVIIIVIHNNARDHVSTVLITECFC